MPLSRLLQNQAFEPEHVQAISSVFEQICRERDLLPIRDDTSRELVAAVVIEFAQRGITDPPALRLAVDNAVIERLAGVSPELLTELRALYRELPSAHSQAAKAVPGPGTPLTLGPFAYHMEKEEKVTKILERIIKIQEIILRPGNT